MAKIAHYDIGDLWTPQITWKIDANNDGVPDTPTDPRKCAAPADSSRGGERLHDRLLALGAD